MGIGFYEIARVVALVMGLAAPAMVQAAACAFDQTYGDAGQARIELDDAPVAVLDAALDNAGRLVVGVALTSPGPALGVIRLTRDGRLDGTFAKDGLALWTVPSVVSLFQIAVAVAADGRIVVAGTTGGYGTAERAISVVRFDADGVLDGSFGVDGAASFFDTEVIGYDAAFDTAGRVLVTGTAPESIVLRLDSNGDLDPSFAGDGIASVPIPPGFFSAPVGITTVGDLVVLGGRGGFNDAPALWAARLTAAGDPDSGFGGGTGFAQIPSTEFNTDAYGIAIDPSGGVAVSGSNGRSSMEVKNYEMLVARFDAAGVPLASFGINGLVRMGLEPAATSGDNARGIAFRPDGRLEIIATGRPDQVGAQSSGDLVLVRLAADGQPSATECDAVTRVATSTGYLGFAGEAIIDGPRVLGVGIDGPPYQGGAIFVVAFDPSLIFASGFEAEITSAR